MGSANTSRKSKGGESHVTSQLILWDAGTEVNQEPGFGPDQAPRQKAPNTGKDEREAIRPVKDVKDGFTYPSVAAVIRVTITPEK